MSLSIWPRFRVRFGSLLLLDCHGPTRSHRDAEHSAMPQDSSGLTPSSKRIAKQRGHKNEMKYSLLPHRPGLQGRSRYLSISEAQREATCKVLAGCPGNKMHCQCDPLKNICPSILAALFIFPSLSCRDCNTIHMAKKSRASSSWKKDCMIKTADNVMVGGLPADIVIPCESMHRFSLSHCLLKKSTVCS